MPASSIVGSGWAILYPKLMPKLIEAAIMSFTDVSKGNPKIEPYSPPTIVAYLRKLKPINHLS